MGAGITDDFSLFNWTDDGYVETHIYSWSKYYRYNEEEGARYDETYINDKECSVEEFELVYKEIATLRFDETILHYEPYYSSQTFPLIFINEVGGDFTDYIAENLYY